MDISTIIVEYPTPELKAAFKNVSLVALDIEGIDLGRNGRISLVQLSPSPHQCFLLDLLIPGNDLIDWLRNLLESESIIKIVHDCRSDSDALDHLLDIRLTRVHDTSCWHSKLTGCDDVSLNNVLIANQLKPNTMRDGRVYAENNAFWAVRPLTPQMIQWAAGDVRSMFELYARQIEASSLRVMLEANFMSTNHLAMARDARVEFVQANNTGAFVGKSGRNIRSLQKKTNTLIYPRGKGLFMVYYHEDSSLLRVRNVAAVS